MGIFVKLKDKTLLFSYNTQCLNIFKVLKVSKILWR